MGTILTGAQDLWPDSYATSESCKLTLRVNSEELSRIITPYGGVVRAGIEAPTVAPTTALVGTPGLVAGYYVYRYVYASTKYPYVDNAVTTGNGQLWPRSNPSPPSAAAHPTGGNLTVTVTVTKTQRADIDKIVIYRTGRFDTSADAVAASANGDLFVIGTVGNDGISGTTTLSDNGLVDTGELLETDNYLAPTGAFCRFTGRHFVIAGEFDLDVAVTLDGSSDVVITSSGMWDGRDAQIATFDGVLTGGFDGRGSFYVKSNPGIRPVFAAILYQESTLTNTMSVPFSGTTTMHVRGFSSTLYRSKPNNPLSWGVTDVSEIQNSDGSSSVEKVPHLFAMPLPGGNVSALAVAANGRILKVDFENPQRTVVYDLSFANGNEEDLGETEKIIDETNSCTAHFTQFNGLLGQQTLLLGLDTYNGVILACDGYRQMVVSDPLGLYLTNNLIDVSFGRRFFHGGYDPLTEMNCFWVKTIGAPYACDTLIWSHSSGLWSWTPDYNVSCSGTILDSTTGDRFLMGGTENGHIGRLFTKDVYENWMNQAGWRSAMVISNSTTSGGYYRFDSVINPASVSQPITAYNLTAQTVTLNAIPTCSVGDTVYIVDVFSGTITANSVVSISGNVVTLATAFDAPADPYLMIGAEHAAGVWTTILKADGKDYWQALLAVTATSLSGTVAFSWRVDKYIQRGTTTFYQTNGGTAPWSNGDLLLFGQIPSVARSYFTQQTPDRDKSNKEIWFTAENVELSVSNANPNPRLSLRFYREFDDTGAASETFIPLRDARPDHSPGAADSINWYKKTEIPSIVMKQFGFEWAETGYSNFKLYNFIIKNDTL